MDSKNFKWTPKEIEKRKREEEKFNQKMKIELMKSESRKNKMTLKEIKHKYRYGNERKKKLTSTKIFMYYILINCTVVEIYSMYIMFYLKDLSALVSLIGAVIGDSICYAIYCAKSFKETKEEANIRLERDKFEASLSNTDDVYTENNEDDSDDDSEIINESESVIEE